MNETRQVAFQQDENEGGDLKAAGVSKGAVENVKTQPGPMNNRRALGDIGNLVGAAAGRSNAGKDGLPEVQIVEKKATAAEKPATRSFGAQVIDLPQASKESSLQPSEPTQQEKQADSITTWGNKQKRAGKKQDVTSDPKMPDELPPGPMKALPNGRNRRAAGGKGRRGRTLTATLTARSEAVCGGCLQTDIVEELLDPDIDAADIGNQLAVVDYIEDIYSFYRKTEAHSCVAPDYMSHQTNINEKMRAILIDWLIEVHLKFRLMPETLFLTTNVIDRYLAVQSVERKNLQLVGMTAMLVASKYEEVWAPEMQDFIFISANAYTQQKILDMEKIMLNTLKFNLCVPTPYVFMVRFLKAASSDHQMNMLAFYLVELCLVDYTMVKFPPSMLSASAVYTALYTVKEKEACWNATLRRHSGYTEQQLIECANKMVALHQRAGEETLKVVHRKYSLAKFSSVALLSPAILPIAADTSGSSTTE